LHFIIEEEGVYLDYDFLYSLLDGGDIKELIVVFDEAVWFTIDLSSTDTPQERTRNCDLMRINDVDVLFVVYSSLDSLLKGG
ncbi:unnamed protein product, partial [marine sediment metagenome]